jgi:hypothetical protein
VVRLLAAKARLAVRLEARRAQVVVRLEALRLAWASKAAAPA